MSGPSSCHEADPIVRFAASTDRPSSADFAISAMVGIALGLAVAEILPQPWRKLWLAGAIGLEGWEVVGWVTLRCSPPTTTPPISA
ncbi:MAG TPA: hypothetical protein VKV28_00050, partial [Candidatus Binataceae bacterium]|nr:hypothetical protein [Candidatus Binataceae bacterium]